MSPDDSADASSLFTSWLVDQHTAAVFEATPHAAPGEGTEPGEDDELRKQAQASLRALEQLRRGWQSEPACIEAGGTVGGPGDALLEVPRVGRFELHEELGRGGHGVVYRAFDPKLHRDVALKLPRVEAVFSPEMRERFLREARAVSALNHPHLVPTYEVGETGPLCYIVSQYCCGPSLSQWLKAQDRPVGALLAAHIICELADAVSYVHRHGILHRDLKPGNVLLFEGPWSPPSQTCPSDRKPLAATMVPQCDGAEFPFPGGGAHCWGDEDFPFVPKLADFGLAKINDGLTMTGTGAIAGTPAYMSPEQAEGRFRDLDARTDVYSLGVILYELLTGRPPFQGTSDVSVLKQVSEGSFPAPRKVRGDIPRDLEAVCLKCLALDPNSRYPTADSLWADLKRSLVGQPVRARPAGPIRRLLNWGRRKPVVAGLGGTLLLSMVTALAVITWQWRVAEEHRRDADRNFQMAHQELREIQSILDAAGTYDGAVFQPLRTELMQALSGYYETLGKIQPDNAALRADLADALYHRGYLAEAAGEMAEAEKCYVQALPLWEGLVREGPDVSSRQYYLAKVHEHIANVLSEGGDADTAMRHREQALAIRQALVERHPNELKYQNELAYSYRSLAEWHLERQSNATARELFLAAYQLRKPLLESDPDSNEFRLQQSKVCYKLGQVHQRLTQLDTALMYCKEGKKLHESLLAEDPGNFATRYALALNCHLEAFIQSQRGEGELALKAHSEAQNYIEQLLRNDPDGSTKYRLTLQAISAHLAELQDDSGRPPSHLGQASRR